MAHPINADSGQENCQCAAVALLPATVRINHLRLIKTFGIAWYTAEGYSACVKVMVDAANFPKKHAAWLAQAEKGEASLTRKGHSVVRANIEASEFASWCEFHRLPCDAKARGRYAQEWAVGQTTFDTVTRLPER
jgi:hypothetical protein